MQASSSPHDITELNGSAQSAASQPANGHESPGQNGRNGHSAPSPSSSADTQGQDAAADELASALRAKLENRDATIGVLGLGYVGVPLIMAFASQGFRTIGFDPNERLVQGLQGGVSHIEDISGAEIAAAREGDRFRATQDFGLLAECDVAIICVPTPLNTTRDPDLKYVESASKSIAKYLHEGQLVVLESTTYPGTTDEIVRPILEEDGLKAGQDFFLAFSPERIDPGNVDFPVHKVPKVVGGHEPRSTELALLLYSTVVSQPVPVSSTQAAELTKLLENIFRCVNIALVNEMTMLCDRMDIDIWEVIDAAATKPYGFTKFLPGPGLGGHCIPIDPFYLSWKAREFGFQTAFIELAGEVNSAMPKFVIEKITRALNDESKSIRGSKIGLLGMSYKANVGDVRESPSLRVAELLQEMGAEIHFFDPHVESAVLFHGTPRAAKNAGQHRARCARLRLRCAAHQPPRLQLRAHRGASQSHYRHAQRLQGHRESKSAHHQAVAE